MYISKRKRPKTAPIRSDAPARVKEKSASKSPEGTELDGFFADYIPAGTAELISTAEQSESTAPMEKRQAEAPEEITEEEGADATDESVPPSEKSDESTTFPPPFSAPTESNSDITFEEFERKNRETGILRVQAFIGNQGLPVPDATVIVFSAFRDGEKIFYTVKTDADGVADDLILPAPSRENSALPGSTNPYAEYSITVSHPDYLSQRYEKVPIFAGIRSIQPVAFLPSISGG